MPSPSENSPWPAQTQEPLSHPTSQSKLKRRRSRSEFRPRASAPRQIIADQSAIDIAKEDCEVFSGNNVISCFPTANTTIPQNEWATFVWNSQRPELTQTNLVNIYMFRADSQEQLLFFPNQINDRQFAGSVTAQVNDTWFGVDGPNWSGSNISYPYYWVITRADESVDTAIPQSTFSAIQTTYPNSILASMSSTSAAAAASASRASASSASAASRSGHLSPSSTSGAGSVQSDLNGSSFPHWAIAVIVVLGFLAIVATCILAFLVIRRLRHRNRSFISNRNSMGSASPMIEQHTGNSPQSPLLAGAVLPVHRQPSSVGHHAPSVVSPDGASTISGDAGPFSGADAAIMADAFRKALRKPDFAGRPVEEGESPDTADDQKEKEELLNRELAEEGRDIRSVGSSRGVRVETLDGNQTDATQSPTQSPPH